MPDQFISKSLKQTLIVMLSLLIKVTREITTARLILKNIRYLESINGRIFREFKVSSDVK